jgi:hypothetical protein
MLNAGRKIRIALLCLLDALAIHAQLFDPASLDTAGQVVVNGRSTPYLIRRLPVSSFPQLPAAVQAELNRRGCLIPQSYEAHGPENVVRGSVERRGSADWVALCSVQGTVSLLVFFGDSPDEPAVLASVPETERLGPTTLSGQTAALGFNWEIDVATPERVHAAQVGMRNRPAMQDHDAVAESEIDQWTIYHYFDGGRWKLVVTGD